MGQFTPSDFLPIHVRHDNEAMPFELAEPVVFTNAITEVTIPRGFELDFASVPRALWWLFPRVGRYARAALVHDALYRETQVQRVQADALFLAIMTADGVAGWQKWPMYAAVRCFGGRYWRRNVASNQPLATPCPTPRNAARDDAVRASAITLLVVSVVLMLLFAAMDACGQGVCGPGGCYPGTRQVTPYQSPGITRDNLSGPARQVMESTVRIVHRDARGDALGSGTIVAHEEGSTWVLTCSHLFDDGPGRTSVRHRSQEYGATIVRRDRQHDLALLRTGPIREATPIDIADPAASEILYACGFGGEGRLRAVRGRVAGRVVAQGAESPSVVISGGQVRGGDSGGPMFNARGELVGVVWGARDGRSYAMTGGPIRRVLGRLFPVIAERRRAAIARRQKPPVPVERSDPVAPIKRRPLVEANPPDTQPQDDPQEDQAASGSPWITPDEPPRQAPADGLARRVGELARWSLPMLGALGAGVGGPIGVGLVGAAWLRRRRESRQYEPTRPLGGDAIPAGGAREAPRDDGFPRFVAA